MGPRIFTPERVAIMRRMAADGATAEDIAKAIGSTVTSVRTKTAVLKISLRKGKYLGASVPTDVAALCITAAEQRGVTIGALVRKLLITVAQDDLFDAILDDADNGNDGLMNAGH